jgi:hypothetical protein
MVRLTPGLEATRSRHEPSHCRELADACQGAALTQGKAYRVRPSKCRIELDARLTLRACLVAWASAQNGPNGGRRRFVHVAARFVQRS